MFEKERVSKGPCWLLVNGFKWARLNFTTFMKNTLPSERS